MAISLKKITTILLLIILILPTIFADGGFIIRDQDMWIMHPEKQQYAAINYKNGFQNMILTIDINEDLQGDKGVWIFPIPAKPEKTVINIIRGFPQLTGYDVQEKADESITAIFFSMMATQIVPMPLILLQTLFGGAANKFGALIGDGVTIHESIERMGLTTELITTEDETSFITYLSNKKLTLPNEFYSILKDYIGKEYSFVVSWISNLEEFKLQKIENSEIRRRSYRSIGNIGVSITFPTEKIYYPLKPTSVYGSLRVPAIIYVMDYVTPELYSEIKTDSEINYFFQRRYKPTEELKDFFFSQDNIQDLKYTKIKINPPSKYLTKDLWIKKATPFRVTLADIANRFPLIYGFFFIILLSGLASILAAKTIFKKEKPSISRFFLYGLWNLTTLIGFGIRTYFMKTKDISKKSYDYIIKNGTRLVKDKTKQYITTISILIVILLAYVLLFKSIGMEIFAIILTPIISIVILIIIFKMSREEIKENFKKYLKKDLTIIDLKKSLFLIIFNLSISIGSMIFIMEDYQRSKNIANFLGLVKLGFNGKPYPEIGAIPFFVIISVFIISMTILLLYQILAKESFKTKGWTILLKDNRKICFVALFSVFFIVLCLLFMFVLILIV